MRKSADCTNQRWPIMANQYFCTAQFIEITLPDQKGHSFREGKAFFQTIYTFFQFNQEILSGNFTPSFGPIRHFARTINIPIQDMH
jgi:hypothetical protein